MAAYAAHLTRTLQGTPSVFQVTVQEALGATVKPALGKLIEYLATVHPNKFGWCERWFDELYLVFDCFLQYHYLKHYAGSFSETFYGLMRVPTASAEFESGARLPVGAERVSLALLTLAPYLRDRAERRVQRWRADDDDGLLGQSGGERVRRACVRVYSCVHLVVAAARVLQLARYLTGRSAAHAPALAALGLALRDAPPRAPWRPGGGLGGAALGALVLRAAEYGAFAVQFLRWWDSRAGPAAAALPAPPPPPKDETCIRMKNKCPICLQSWKIPTVLPVSGYIYCYVCISRHVRARGACAVSRAPAAEHDLVRLYLDT